MKGFKFNISDRKLMFMFLCIIVLSIFSLTMVYAALSVTLNIKGNAEVAAAGWDVHFDNIIHLELDNAPVITSPTSITFNPVLNAPGEKYFFTVDIVNDGGIDAMIESIEKKPELTSEQAKYLKYEISYANGDSVNEKQLVEAGKFVRVKVSLEYRSDVVASDLPTSQLVLDLSIKLNYVQGNDEGSSIGNYGISNFDIVKVEDDILGSEICLSGECFYYIDESMSDDGTYTDAILMAKYNLYVGNKVTYINSDLVNEKFESLDFTTVKQDSRAIGADVGVVDGNVELRLPWYGTIPFSDAKYWEDDWNLNQILYNDNNNIFKYLFKYMKYLNDLGHEVTNIAIPPGEWVVALGCTSTECDYEFLNSTSYWLMEGFEGYGMLKDYGIGVMDYNSTALFGIRPIILYRVYKN